jgi:hypothetical protein
MTGLESDSRFRLLWIALSFLVVAAFLAVVSTYYQRPFGVTAFIDFPLPEDYELPKVRATLHAHDATSGGYDGQFYAQLAVEPLLRDAAIDRAMDLAPYRAHRILFSWTAYVLGLGRPQWILHVYALQNVVAWLILAWVLTRWMSPTTGRGFVLWAGSLWSIGLLSSVRYALADGPSVLLIALAVAAAERGRPWIASAIIGVAGLAREPNLIAASMLGRFLRRNPRTWLLVAGCLLVCFLPLALWLDYLRSIYRSLTLVGGDHITTPLTGFLSAVRDVFHAARRPSLQAGTIGTAAALIAFVTQGAYVIVTLLKTRRAEAEGGGGARRAEAEGGGGWAFVAGSFLVLALVTHRVVWEGWPGAFARVFLPLSIGSNALLGSRPQAPWPVIVLANLGVIPGILLFCGRILN